MISITLSIGFQHKPVLYKFISCAKFVWRLPLKYAKCRGQSSLCLLNSVRGSVQFQYKKHEKGNEGEKQLEKPSEKYFVCQKSQAC